MLQVENLTFAYAKGRANVFTDFSLTFAPGHIYGLLGKNGVGKSTLLYLMSGLLTPNAGRVSWNGENTRMRSPQVLQDFFIVPEEFDLPSMLLSDFIRMYIPFYPKFSMDDLLKNLQVFHMDLSLNLSHLSMGQKKKVFMSFALATHTSVLLMDEPTNGLDIPAKSQFRKLMASGMSDDKIIIISTHQVRDIDKLLDVVVIMDHSEVLLQASTTEIVEKLFFIESDDRSLSQDALFSLPSIQGSQFVLRNPNGKESDINLELLFGAVLHKPEVIKELFHCKNI